MPERHGDTTENWDVLNHAPPVSEREIATLGHVFLQDAEGFRHASAGPLVCLADGITPPVALARENWQAAYERRPGRVLGATVVWSEAALEAEIADYPLRHVLTRHKIASELQRRGGPLQVVAPSSTWTPRAAACSSRGPNYCLRRSCPASWTIRTARLSRSAARRQRCPRPI